MEEIWKEVDIYKKSIIKVSNLGRVMKNDEIIIPHKNKNGYYIGSRTLRKIIAEQFIPNPNNYRYVINKNRDLYDNRVENLEWLQAPSQLDSARKKLSECFSERPHTENMKKAASNTLKKLWQDQEFRERQIQRMSNPLSEETKQKIGEAHMNKHLSEEHRKSISETMTGRKRPEFSEEWRNNMKEAAKKRMRSKGCYQRSEEFKKFMSEIQKGRKNHIVKQSEETKQKMREAQQRRRQKEKEEKEIINNDNL